MREPRETNGFTLVEMLVVIAIIGILAGIIIPSLMAGRRRAGVRAEEARVETLADALRQYANDFQDYPPSSLERLGQPSNGVNDGIEAVVRCLTTQEEYGPYLEPESERLKNGDGDRVRENFNRSYIESTEAFELVDRWGNPYVYLHNADYDDPGDAATYRIGGERVTVRAARDETTEQYRGFTEFQLWSVGPNGENENGGGDDIPSW